MDKRLSQASAEMIRLLQLPVQRRRPHPVALPLEVIYKEVVVKIAPYKMGHPFTEAVSSVVSSSSQVNTRSLF